MVKGRMLHPALIFLALLLGLTILAGDYAETFAEGTNSKAFKILREKSINPQTGLPKTLDPNIFRGEVKKAYQVAREIPEIVAQMPCLCECEAFGHENLLDCFIDNHAAG